MRNYSLRRLLRDAWRQERSKDPEQDSTLDLLATDRLAREVDRLVARAVAMHLTRRAGIRTGGTQ